MAGLDPAILVEFVGAPACIFHNAGAAGMAGSSPAMTILAGQSFRHLVLLEVSRQVSRRLPSNHPTYAATAKMRLSPAGFGNGTPIECMLSSVAVASATSRLRSNTIFGSSTVSGRASR